MPKVRKPLDAIRSTRQTKNQRETNRDRARAGLPTEQETLTRAVQRMMGMEPE